MKNLDINNDETNPIIKVLGMAFILALMNSMITLMVFLKTRELSSFWDGLFITGALFALKHIAERSYNPTAYDKNALLVDAELENLQPEQLYVEKTNKTNDTFEVLINTAKLMIVIKSENSKFEISYFDKVKEKDLEFKSNEIKKELDQAIFKFTKEMLKSKDDSLINRAKKAHFQIKQDEDNVEEDESPSLVKKTSSKK